MGLRAKQLNLPLPGAIASGTPMSDMTKIGDTFYTNEMVDNVLVSRDGFCDAGAKVYADGHDLKDPLISPVYGDYAGFPPTILTSGTRDLLLSNTVRVHRKLRDAGVESVLQVFEGQSHAHYLRDDRAGDGEPSPRSRRSSTSTWGNNALRHPRGGPRPGRWKSVCATPDSGRPGFPPGRE